jgi:uncharacterized protein
MRPIGALLLYLTAVFIGGPLLAPWLYWSADGMGLMDAAWSPSFHKFVTRCLLLVALLGMWPLLRFSRLDSWRALGLARLPGWRGQVALGCLVGFASLAIVAAGALAAGSRAWAFDATLPSVPLVLSGAFATAIAVALVEESLFRGAIFGALRQFNHWLTALLISSAVYSIVHFFQKVTVAPSRITWISGIELLPKMFRGFADPQHILPAFFVLLLAGAILAAAYQRTGSLHFSIGLHAGWIFVAQSYAIFTKQHGPPIHRFWGGTKMIDGWCGAIVLVPLLVWFLWPPARTKIAPTSGVIRAAGEPTGAEL